MLRGCQCCIQVIAQKVNIITRPTRQEVAANHCMPVNALQPDAPKIQAVVVTGSELRIDTEEKWECCRPTKR